MKVVLFCGGMGTRMREFSERIPKPLVNVGNRPIIWHLMKYYASYGHTDFVICLGYRGDLIRRYFLDYDERDVEDFVLEQGISTVNNKSSDVRDWKISFVDTGQYSNIGERLMAVKDHVVDEEVFLANYSDQLSDLPLDKYLEFFNESQAVGSFIAVTPSQSFHIVDIDESGNVNGLNPVEETDVLVNGGFLVLRNSIFDHMMQGDELVIQPFERLIKKNSLVAYRYHGFWKAMDTFKDKVTYDDMHDSGHRPWEVWRA